MILTVSSVSVSWYAQRGRGFYGCSLSDVLCSRAAETSRAILLVIPLRIILLWKLKCRTFFLILDISCLQLEISLTRGQPTGCGCLCFHALMLIPKQNSILDSDRLPQIFFASIDIRVSWKWVDSYVDTHTGASIIQWTWRFSFLTQDHSLFSNKTCTLSTDSLEILSCILISNESMINVQATGTGLIHIWTWRVEI